MERVLIKPEAKEIVVRGKEDDGHVDVFSYNYEGSAANGLGALFIVGHVQPASEDTSYMVNLVASLAKREYYAQADSAPKEAFSKTLKRINEVLQDFFRNKETKVNIGIFAIAGENIFISRLGKFKIILARDGQTIDILNNINLFSKEHIQEKEFSNIISGRVMPQDKVLAFYPGRSITAREKNIKNFLIKLGRDEFSEKINDIKTSNDKFSCAAIHISINKYMEPAIVNAPQPQELRQRVPSMIKTAPTAQPVVAKITKIIQTEPEEELPMVRPAESKSKTEAKSKSKPTPPPIPSKPEREESNVFYPGNPSVLSDQMKSSEKKGAPEPSSLIRPSEFSSAKKGSFLGSILNGLKPSRVYRMGMGRGNGTLSGKKLIAIGSIVAVIILALIAKFTFAPSLPIPGIDNAEDRAASALIDQVGPKLDSAQSYLDQNNMLEARRNIFESLLILASNPPQSEKINKVKNEALRVLDEIDKATEASPVLFYQLSEGFGTGSLITAIQGRVFVYTLQTDDTGGKIAEISSGNTDSITAVKDFDPGYMLGNDKLIALINKTGDKIGSIARKGEILKTSTLSLSGTPLSMSPYQNNLYVLTSDNVYKIMDAADGKSSATVWLNKDTALPTAPLIMAVDSRIFILSTSGILTTYYKGARTSEINTSIPVDSSNVLLTTSGSPYLYLVAKNLNRIYTISKDSGSVVKALKIGEGSSIADAALSDDETVYLLMKDNKIWQVKP